MWEIYDKALEPEPGPRGFRSIMEGALLEVLCELQSRRDVTKCVITKETISQGIRPTLVTRAEGADDEPDEPVEQTPYLAKLALRSLVTELRRGRARSSAPPCRVLVAHRGGRLRRAPGSGRACGQVA